ncbi:MobC family plasmid mobilization relaxosome protein [Prevotellaceae bacterium LKV-178-WT-2A]|uniref:MobC family plasmid mobilization relaxosome protein n=1 Tax=Hallella mizrahii TaxID=2606637 RepID=A0A7K0KKQ9_9BACT|nr:MobC family plasmid mobilization relaxosome protein [Hallella mizrahii]
MKSLAKKTAGEHFGGNMSDMFRYALHHCNFQDDGDCSYDDERGKDFTRMDRRTLSLLSSIHDEYARLNTELGRIGNNINQIAYHVNAQSMSSPSPVTRQSADALEDIRKAMNSMRTSNANIWKRVKEHLTHNSKTEEL